MPSNDMRVLRLAVALAVLAAVLPATNASAFTLISGVTKLFIRPSNALATAPFNVLATWQTQNQCFPSPGPVTFRFNFDSTEVWFTNVNLCDPNLYLWTTGWSPNLHPPAPATPGAHKITVTAYGPPGNAQLQGINPVSGTYTINRPPPPPSPQKSPSPRPSPSPSPSSTATSTPPCQTASTLPPAGTGGFVDNLIAGAMVSAVLPILGLALFGSPARMLAAVGRRRRILELLGLGLLVVGVLSCTSTSGQGPGQSPVAAVSSPSSQATPSESSSASPSC